MDGRTGPVEERDHAFHRSIDLAAGSAELPRSPSSAARYVPRGLYGRLPDWPRTALTGHEAVRQELGQADPQRAAAMRAHIVCAGGLLIAHLERQGLWNGSR